MADLIDLLPYGIAMGVLIIGSAFFSASEAALFSLRMIDRRQLAGGNRAQRLADHLLDDSERLLSAVLFYNLAVNMVYFAIVSIVGLRLERGVWGQSGAVAFAILSLVAIIFFSEMVPKTMGVLLARTWAGVAGVPLSLAVRLVDPLMPLLRMANTLSRRLLWPRFQAEKHLDITDLERAIEISTSDAHLIKQEQAALQNIVLLSDIRVDEWMRPRTQFLTFRPPVSLSDLKGKMTPSGYLLMTEPDSEEVAAALHLKELFVVPRTRLEFHGEPVIYVPWCATVADALQAMQDRERQVAAIVNEYGETIGILTFEDILDTIFSYSPSRSKLLLDKKPIHDLSHDTWLVAGVTSLRRLERYLEVKFPPSKSVTIAGVIQEQLQRLAQAGDTCRWGRFQMKVLEVPQRGHMLVELKRLHDETPPEEPA